MSDLQQRIRDLAIYAIGPREDWRWMVPQLEANIRTSVNSYRALFMGRNRHTPGFESPEDWQAFWLPQVDAMNQAWPAQIQDGAKK